MGCVWCSLIKLLKEHDGLPADWQPDQYYLAELAYDLKERHPEILAALTLPAWRDEWPDSSGTWLYWGNLLLQDNRMMAAMAVKQQTIKKKPVWVAVWQGRSFKPTDGKLKGLWQKLPAPEPQPINIALG